MSRLQRLATRTVASLLAPPVYPELLVCYLVCTQRKLLFGFPTSCLFGSIDKFRIGLPHGLKRCGMGLWRCCKKALWLSELIDTAKHGLSIRCRKVQSPNSGLTHLP